MKNTKFVANMIKLMVVLFMLIGNSFAEAAETKINHTKKKSVVKTASNGHKKIAAKAAKKSERSPASNKHHKNKAHKKAAKKKGIKH